MDGPGHQDSPALTYVATPLVATPPACDHMVVCFLAYQKLLNWDPLLELVKVAIVDGKECYGVDDSVVLDLVIRLHGPKVRGGGDRAVCRNFSKGGQIWGTNKRGGAEAYVRCYTLHLLGGTRMTQGGANAPPAPP